MSHVIDRDWFVQKLEERHKSLRGLARHLDRDPAALSRMLAGKRRMKMEEANQIALFLGVTVHEVLRHAGVSIDLDGQPTRVLLAATIDESGSLKRLAEPRPLPQSVIDRAQDALGRMNGQAIAAQVRAATGPLAIWDDAVVLFAATDTVEPGAIGVLAICRDKDGNQVMARVERARKTGEATIRSVSDKPREISLMTATPVLAIIP